MARPTTSPRSKRLKALFVTEVYFDIGVFRYRVDCWDNSLSGIADAFGIKLYDQYGIVYHEAGGIDGYLQEGNVTIHRKK